MACMSLNIESEATLWTNIESESLTTSPDDEDSCELDGEAMPEEEELSNDMKARFLCLN